MPQPDATSRKPRAEVRNTPRFKGSAKRGGDSLSPYHQSRAAGDKLSPPRTAEIDAALDSRIPPRRHLARGTRPASLNAAFKRVRLLLCDVDGVLTDASVFIGGAQEMKRFNIRDGLGLVRLRSAGLKVGWISGRPSLATTRRARELKIDFLRQGKGS